MGIVDAEKALEICRRCDKLLTTLGVRRCGVDRVENAEIAVKLF